MIVEKLPSLFFFWLILCSPAIAQNTEVETVDFIIEKIANLESTKDPKCYATANRLEDFMYGTPLTDAARNLRIEVQKEIGLFVRTRASAMARANNRSVITDKDIVAVVDSIATVGKLNDGDFFYKADSLVLRIRKLDFDQYSSVAYGFRSLLSIEQDLLFIRDQELLPLHNDAVDVLNGFLNLTTLASLSMGDMIARDRQLHEISEDVMRESWIRILRRPENKDLFAFEYPRVVVGEGGNAVLKNVIQQKVDSYDRYNDLSTSVFLRNIQVFFARQKWPSDEKVSAELKNYFVETLIVFTKELIRHALPYAQDRKDGIIRILA